MIHVQDLLVRLLLSISLFSTIHKIHATFNGNDTDRLALLAFKRSILQDPQGALSSWNDSFHFCQWEGVRCGRRHQRVTRLDIISKGLAGPLSPFVGNLSFLLVLQLLNNSLYGEIPPQLGNLFRLKALNLNNNNFEGEFPANISRCSNLTILGVSYNNLSGKIPTELSALSGLTILIINHNKFTGPIPHFLVNMTLLQTLSVAQNLFSGSIPDSIGQLTNLNILNFGFNNLSGMIPPSLYNLSLLTILTMDENPLQGTLPSSIGSMFPHLQHIQLTNNQFTGSIPISFSNCSNLEIFQLSNNNFDGKLAIDFGRLENIKIINLQENNLGSGETDEMNFIGSAANCSKLKFFTLEANKLRGSLPNFVGNLSSELTFLDFGENQLYGTVPSTISNLVGLTTLALFDNQFTDTIPTNIGNLAKLQRLHLYKNIFSGTIPISIGNMSLLIELYMNMNRLEDTIPESIGNCKSLLFLEISQNNLSGSIPKQLFRLPALSILLNLSGNHLNGSLLLDGGSLKNLGTLDLSRNDLSGEIPSGLGSFSSLENLFLKENNFQGSIPSSLSSLKGLTNLDLSHNNLSGKIPKFFEELNMTYLNLSFNNFEGEVPMRGVFANQSAISVVGNNKLCGGIHELHLDKCLTKESNRHRGRTRAVIIVISTICTLLSVATMLWFLFCRRKQARKIKSYGQLQKEPFLRVSYEKLLKATNGFSLENVIGKGGFGIVYKGILEVDEVVVAVKVLNLQSQGVSKSFMNECEALRGVRHRNILKIISSCSGVDFQGNDFKALVYDFMPNGNLDKWLHASPEAKNEEDRLHRLGLLQRIDIVIDVACALDYLHYHCEKPIIHCDLKPSNILLDGDMVARVGDFGIAKFLHPELSDATQSISIGLRGTIGYAAPEYGIGSEISTSGDVYSFGILLLEVITGKRPTDDMFKEGLNLHNFAKMALPDHVEDIVDPLVFEDNEETTEGAKKDRKGLTRADITECMISATKIGVACSVEAPQARMSIKTALRDLNLIRNTILQH